MYLLVIISVLISLMINNVDCKRSEISVTTENQKIQLNSNKNYLFAYLNVFDIPWSGQYSCQHVVCVVDSHPQKFECNITSNENNGTYYIHAKIDDLEVNQTSNWDCDISIKIPNQQTPSQQKHNNEINNKKVKFQLIIPEDNKVTDNSHLLYIISVILFIAVIIIILQTSYIFHYRLKAKAVISSTEPWPEKGETPENTVRYIKMPTQNSLKAVQSAADRESGLYEALDTVKEKLKDSQAPKPPSLATLPRFANKVKSNTSVSSTQRDHDVPESPSFSTKKGNKAKKESTKKDRSSTEIIRDRPPLPLPTQEEVYEEMCPPSPPAICRQKLEATLDEFKPFSTPKPAQKFHMFGQTPPSKPALAPAHVQPMKSPLPLRPSELKRAAELKKIGSPQQKLSPIIRPQPEQSPFPKRAVPPVSKKPKPKPPPPSKPKQLHPLPPPPLEPTSIPVRTEHAEVDSEDEEWTYEPLPNYNFDNIYSE